MNKDIKDLQKLIIQFRDDRDWRQFHKIKDLLLGLGMEVSELQELFLWKNDDEIHQISKEEIEEEVADIFIFLSYICYEYNIELGEAVLEKIKKNGLKYPVEQSKGSIKKYNELGK